MPLLFWKYLGVDDVFVRKDVLKTKYTYVDFAEAENFKFWCSHWSKCVTKDILPGKDKYFTIYLTFLIHL